MNSEEYDRLAAVERDHWFYRGKRRLVARWLARAGALGPNKRLLDVGAGTGRFVEEIGDRCQAVGVDDHAEALAIAARHPKRHVVPAAGEGLPFADAVFDAVTALDVLEHLADDVAGAREAFRVLKPGGVFLVTVPALRLLWSDWDVALHHHRRYHKPELRRTLLAAGFVVERLRYINEAMLLPILAVRKWRGRRREAAGPRLEDRVPPAWLNRPLEALFVGTATLPGWSPPAGVSLLAVARRPG